MIFWHQNAVEHYNINTFTQKQTEKKNDIEYSDRFDILHAIYIIVQHNNKMELKVFVFCVADSWWIGW